MFSTSRAAVLAAAVCSVCSDSPSCFPTYLRNVLDIMRVRSKCFWVGVHVLQSKSVPVVLLMKTWTSAHNLTDQHNYKVVISQLKHYLTKEQVTVNCFATILLWRQMCLCQRTPGSDLELWLEWLFHDWCQKPLCVPECSGSKWYYIW